MDRRKLSMGISGHWKAIIKSYILKFLNFIFPDITLKLLSSRSRYYIEKGAREDGLRELALLASSETSGEVFYGPFKGVRFSYEYLPVHAAPCFIGSYEKEIHEFIESCITAAPEQILVVGSSFGFYAVGFLKRLPSATVYFAEADNKSKNATLRNGALNGVEGRLVSIGIIHSGEFGRYLSKSDQLAVLDCEGAEFALLDPSKDKILANTNILVEIHPTHGSVADLEERFRDTHEIDVVFARPRSFDDMPDPLRGRIPLDALDERRDPHQQWAYFRVKNVDPHQSAALLA